MESTHCEQRYGNGHASGHRPTRGNAKKNAVICPYCHENDEVIPILYGFPTHAGFMKADRGEVYLGGCDISPYNYYCKRDDKEF